MQQFDGRFLNAANFLALQISHWQKVLNDNKCLDFSIKAIGKLFLTGLNGLMLYLNRKLSYVGVPDCVC